MTVDQTANFVRGGVTSSIGSSDTSINVEDASIYPDPANGNYNLVIWDFDQYRRPDLDPDVEIVRVTGRDTTNDVLTVTRAQENTTAVSHPSTSEMHLASTSKIFTDIDDKITSDISVTGSNGLNGGSAGLGGSLDISISGSLDLDGDLTAVDGETIWDESATYIPQTRLENDSMTIAGNSVSLGGSTSINHTNLSNINSDDHHSKYTDSDAISAVEGATFDELAFNNIEDLGTNRSIGIDDSEGVLFKDSGGNTYPLWNSKYVSGGTDLSISGGSGAGSTPITISHDDTSTQSDVSTGGATVIDDIEIDGRGHVTNLNTQDRSLDDWGNANNAISLDNNNLNSVGNLNVSSINSNNGSRVNPVQIDQAFRFEDEIETFYGSNRDFGIFYENASDELVIRDEANGVDLIRQPKQGATEFIQGADIGSIEAPEDSFTQLINVPSTSAASSGDTVGYTFAIDNQTVIEVKGEADGNGGISGEPDVFVNGQNVQTAYWA